MTNLDVLIEKARECAMQASLFNKQSNLLVQNILELETIIIEMIEKQLNKLKELDVAILKRSLDEELDVIEEERKKLKNK